MAVCVAYSTIEVVCLTFFTYLFTSFYCVLGSLESVSIDDLKTSGRVPPKSLRPSAADAYLLFQVCIVYIGALVNSALYHFIRQQ